MNLKAQLLAVVLGLSLIGCISSHPATPTPLPTPDVSVERAIILDVIAQLSRYEHRYVVEKSVYPFISAEVYTNTWPTLPGDLLESFVTKNKTSPQWDKVLIDDERFVFVSVQDYFQGMCCVDMERLWQEFSNSIGIIRLSRVGFNNDNTQALLAVEIITDNYKSDDYMIWLEMIEGMWEVKAKRISHPMY